MLNANRFKKKTKKQHIYRFKWILTFILHSNMSIICALNLGYTLDTITVYISSTRFSFICIFPRVPLRPELPMALENIQLMKIFSAVYLKNIPFFFFWLLGCCLFISYTAHVGWSFFIAPFWTYNIYYTSM